ncbi:MAG: sel1 repeat family protein [Succinivibrionaceae bacterium]|nr:sel1 repeat family protein [Succinivibrionaceae bacterium]
MRNGKFAFGRMLGLALGSGLAAISSAGDLVGDESIMPTGICTEYYNAKNYQAAWQACVHAEDPDDPGVNFALGFMAANGLGTERDDNAAFRYFSARSLESDQVTQYNLGLMYLNGRGTRADKREALVRFRRAASAGHAEAAYNAARILESGEAGSADYPAAMSYYRKAAFGGIASAMMNLGVMYARGHGVSQPDMVEAYAWFACSMRDPSLAAMAKENRNSAASRLPGKMMEKAEARAREICRGVKWNN